ncbi:MAG: hypothetical protein M1470_13805 [Bacteroidetes bacterium]|nr:hypothetical protein [Bacteroidota bacterium]
MANSTLEETSLAGRLLKLRKWVPKTFGVDRAISFVLLGRGFSLFSQPITLFLIARYFTPSIQGYYYTFFSVVATSVFLELGLGYVITQFASHEFAHLSWGEGGVLVGDEVPLSRLLSLLSKSMKWYGGTAFLLIVVLIPGGRLFFASDSHSVTYVLPWVLLVIFTGLGLSLTPILSVVEGCGRIAELQKMKFYQLVAGVISAWIIIVTGGDLLTASALAFANLIVPAVWIRRNFWGLLKQAMNSEQRRARGNIAWRSEVLPMQWRIAISWASGYFIFQLFNPLLFRYQSSIAAGQMGMTISLANVVLQTSVAWVSTKTPLYGALIRKRDYRKLDSLAYTSTRQALLVGVLMSVLIIVFVYYAKLYFPGYGDRVLSIYAIGALLFTNVINVVGFSFAGYLRAHKEEPYLVNSLVMGALTAVVAWICAKYYDADILSFAIAGLNLFVGLPMAIYVFLRKRRDWGIDLIKLNNIVK